MKLLPHHIALLLPLLSLTTAHMSLKYPPQFQTPWNEKATTVDPNHRDPIIRRSFPCKLAHVGMTEEDSVVEWKAGSMQKIEVVGTALHDGGSCQLSLSYDQGKTFRVIHSYIGGCPAFDGWGYEFKLPADTPPGLALFSWSWINRTGNREFYQKCAAVTIMKGSGKSNVPFSQRPLMFEANLDESKSVCKSIEGVDTIFPDPGPDVFGSLDGPVGYTGKCGAKSTTKTSSPPATDDTSSSGDQEEEAAPEEEVEEPFTTTKRQSRPSTAPKSAKANSLPLSPDGSCGSAAGYSCEPGACCGQYNFCGFFEGHCGEGCQAGYGDCGSDKATGGVAAGSGGGDDLSVVSPGGSGAWSMRVTGGGQLVEITALMGSLGVVVGRLWL